jgi:type VI secretion system protein ImpF
MAETYSRDRLQPALLDRLVDDRPSERVEALEVRTISKQRLRQSVLRDLTWLLNAQAGLTGDLDEDRHALVLRSCLNFGIPALSGKLASKIDLRDLERSIRKAIIDYEPRILADSLTVRGVAQAEPLGHHNVLTFEIIGQLWAQPYPLELLLKTDVDLETGRVALQDIGAGPTKSIPDEGGGGPA